MNTIDTNRCPVTEKTFDDFVLVSIQPYIDGFNANTNHLKKQITDKRERIYLRDEDLYLLYSYGAPGFIIPNLFEFEFKTVDINEFTEEDNRYYTGDTFRNTLRYEVPTKTMLKRAFSSIPGAASLLRKSDDLLCVCDDGRYTRLKGKLTAYNLTADVITEKIEDAILIPVISLDCDGIEQLLTKYLIPYALVPGGLDKADRECLEDLTVFYERIKNGVGYIDIGTITAGSYFAKMLKNEIKEEWVKQLHWDLVSVIKKYYESKNIPANSTHLREELLNCEKIRADIEAYEERILTDPNRGHWDLWPDQIDSEYTVEVADKMIARNPVCDINENGVIAIDFGTKSTSVVYQSDIEHSLPMGIGDGNLSKEPSAKRFENPTVMHFVNLADFLTAYNSREGRPKTKWEDLTISHTAMEQFSNSKSEEYYEFLQKIKQWAGQREKQFRVQSHDGTSYVLPAFLDLKDSDWNPIEIYAYYIGLYINNMRKGHGIFLDYYLSFPVTYETKIREKIVESFEKGLKKSLPLPVLRNQELMKKFHVNGDISEPTAYAVCALQEYGFEPKDEEEIFYGIFDFGGGTTDFDFGLWKQSSKRRYDYTIENFGAGGDEYLGGENLLEMLAFEVFKENQIAMRENGFSFTLAPKCTEFPGSDALLADSQEAEKNMHNLMEKLRPYWERTDDSKAEPDNSSQTETEDDEADQIEFKLTLFDKEGKDHPGVILYFSLAKLNQYIEDRIREGVNNFFSALLLSYQNDKVEKPTCVNILLAGNSCKSPVVKKIFNEIIEDQERQIKDKFGIKNFREPLFKIFPPLGTEEAYKIMESRGLTPERNDFAKPTGKTGVAFGLIQCRAGGVIERISNIGIKDEIPFQFFIGWRAKKKFVVFRDEAKISKNIGKPDYNEWYRFVEADDSVFDLYYTSLPECVSGQLMVDGNAGVKRLRCEIDVVDEAASVYIRAIDPHTLEYVVAGSADVENTKLGEVFRKELT